MDNSEEFLSDNSRAQRYVIKDINQRDYDTEFISDEKASIYDRKRRTFFRNSHSYTAVNIREECVGISRACRQFRRNNYLQR